MNRTVKLLIIPLIFVSIFGWLYFLKTPKQVTLHTNWVNQQGNLTQALKNSDLVIIARVNSHYSYSFKGVVFTNHKVTVESNIKSSGDLPSAIEVSQTGGNYEGTIYNVEKQKPLVDGHTYLFILKKRFPDDKDSLVYTPIGGYQGVIKVQGESTTSGKKFVATDFNPDNNLEKEAVNRDILSELIPKLNTP